MTGNHAIVGALALALVAASAGCSKSVEERIAEARLQQEIGSNDEAVDTLRGVLRTEPDQPEANLLLGQTYLKLGQPGLAIWPLQSAARAPKWADQANLTLGAAYLQLEQKEAALETADKVLANAAADVESQAGALRLRAALYLQASEWDEALEDTERLLALKPDDPDALTLRAQTLIGAGRKEQAEKALLDIWDNPTLRDSPVAVRAGMSLMTLHQDEPEKAEARLAALLERYPQNENVLRGAAAYWDRREQPERGTQVLRDALAKEPGAQNVRVALAERLRGQGQADEAEQVLVEGAKLLETPEAYLALYQLYQMESQPEKALAALERTIELMPGMNDAIRFKHAGVLADLDRLDEAQAIAEEIQEPAYRELILGRIAYAKGSYQEALDHLDAGLRRWPNNSGARHVAALAAFGLGDVERGLSELREAVRADPGETEAAVDLARIYQQRGQYPNAAEIAGLALHEAKDPKGGRTRRLLVIYSDAQIRSGNLDQARQAVERLAKLDPDGRDTILRQAQLAAAEHDSAAGAAVLTASSLDLTDPDNEVALRSLATYQLDAGQGQAALARVAAARKAHPEHAGFADAQGRLLAALGHPAEAKAAFEAAVAAEPQYAPAFQGQAALATAAGDSAGAIALLEQASAADPKNAEYVYGIAQLELASGHAPEAEHHLESALKLDPFHAQANNDLAWILAERGDDLERAQRLAKRAAAADSSAEVLDTLGWVQFKRGAHAAAVKTLERALKKDPDSPSIRYRLGLALAETGDTARARELLEKALASGSFPEAEQARAQLARWSETGS